MSTIMVGAEKKSGEIVMTAYTSQGLKMEHKSYIWVIVTKAVNAFSRFCRRKQKKYK